MSIVADDIRNTAAVIALITVAQGQVTVTVDDIVEALEPRYRVSTKFMSAIMASAGRKGVLRKTNQMIRSKRTGGPLTVWTSLLKT